MVMRARAAEYRGARWTAWKRLVRAVKSWAELRARSASLLPSASSAGRQAARPEEARRSRARRARRGVGMSGLKRGVAAG